MCVCTGGCLNIDFSYTQSTITKTCRSTNTNISLLFVLLSATNTNKHTEEEVKYLYLHLELDKSLHQLRTAMRDNYRRVSYHELVLWKFVTSQWLDGDHCICIIGGSRGGRVRRTSPKGPKFFRFDMQNV